MCTCPPFAKLSALGELGNFIKGDAVKNSKCTVCGHCTIHSSTNLPKILLSEGHWNVWNELVCGLDHSDSPMYCLTVRISLFTFYHSWWNEGSEISIALTNYIIESNINSNNYHSVHVYCTYAWLPTWCLYIIMVILKCELIMEYTMSCEKLKGNSSLWMGDLHSVHNAF
jgi:hypothetical protein